MKEAAMAILAFGILTAFLVILVKYVPRWDLGGVVAVTLILCAIDTVAIVRKHQRQQKRSR